MFYFAIFAFHFFFQMSEEKSLEMMKYYEALKDYMNKGYVFKKCYGATKEKYYTCLVVLKKPLEDFKCNESRKDVVDKNFAKFRCNGLITVAIYDLINEEFIDLLEHDLMTCFGYKKIFYQVNKLSIPDLYDENLDIVCTSGIHYFLTLEAALNYGDQYFKNENFIAYQDNGQKIKCKKDKDEI